MMMMRMRVVDVWRSRPMDANFTCRQMLESEFGITAVVLDLV